MLLNKEQVIAFMPHRDPFLFIDSVESIELPDELSKNHSAKVQTSKDLVGAKVKAHFKVTSDMEVLKGHFPGNPILPGVIQVEMMAQSCAFVSLALDCVKSDRNRVETLLLGVESSKFRKPILPGMDLEIRSLMGKSRGNMAHYFCEIYHEGQKVSEAKILARLEIFKKEKS